MTTAKQQILEKVISKGIVAVVRAETVEKAINIAKACLKGGISAIEITYTVPNATEVIKTLIKNFSPAELIIGAGTVLDSKTAKTAIAAGAEFVVSPGFDLETCTLCNQSQIPYIPGCMTVTEIITALKAGADIIKLFPGSVLGPEFVKAVKSPLPQAPLMPTGGVSLDNVKTWIQNGSIAVGVGGELTSGAKTGNYKLITETAKKFIAAIEEARNA